MLQLPPTRETRDTDKNRRRMLLAAVLLLTALAVVLIRDRAYWFGGEQASATDNDVTATSSPSVTVRPKVQVTAPPAPVLKVKREEHSSEKSKADQNGTSVVTTERAVAKPLQVEVVTDRAHRVVQATKGTVNVDLNSDQGMAPVNPTAPAMGTVQPASLTYKVQAPLQYPSLAARMRVQGSVLLQALIGVDGAIRELQVVSGPTILSSAAREAAMQWRFKPYYENGKAVETQARITVNFVIAVADDRARDQQDAKQKVLPHTGHQAAHPGE